MPTDDLTCQQLVELLTDYLESALPPELSATLEAHLARCPGCRAYLAQIRATIGSLCGLAAPDIPPDTLADLLVIFRAWQTEAHHRGAEDTEIPEG